MARVRDVVVRDAPDGPPGQGVYTTKLQALAVDPTKTVVDARFDTLKAVEDAAFRVNSGQRKDWPNDKYYAAFDYDIADESIEGSSAGKWLLLIGLREHAPVGWEPVINAPGSRKRRKSAKAEAEVEQSIEQDADEQSEAENAAFFQEPTE